MTTLAADAAVVDVLGDRNSAPIIADDIVYEGAMVGDNASGYGRPLVAGDPFLGHNIEKVDNTGGAAGDKNITLRSGRYRLKVTLTSVAITDVGKVVYASDDATLTLSQGGNSRVGVVVRYDTTNTCIVEFQTAEVPDLVLADSARSRASTAMPTAAIWDNFNLIEMRNNPLAGSLLEIDFTHGENEPAAQFADTSSVIDVRPGTAGEGTLTLFATADNEAAEVQWPACPITSSGGQPWAIEARFKVSLIDNTKGGAFLGLMAGDTALAGDLIADGGTLADVGSIGFQWKEGDGDILDAVYDKASQTQNEHDDDWHTLVADTYVTVGLYYNGTTIAMYLNGTAAGTAISADDIAAADFPAADILVPTLTLKNAAADDVTVTLDWIKCAQLAA